MIGTKQIFHSASWQLDKIWSCLIPSNIFSKVSMITHVPRTAVGYNHPTLRATNKLKGASVVQCINSKISKIPLNCFSWRELPWSAYLLPNSLELKGATFPANSWIKAKKILCLSIYLIQFHADTRWPVSRVKINSFTQSASKTIQYFTRQTEMIVSYLSTPIKS